GERTRSRKRSVLDRIGSIGRTQTLLDERMPVRIGVLVGKPRRMPPSRAEVRTGKRIAPQAVNGQYIRHIKISVAAESNLYPFNIFSVRGLANRIKVANPLLDWRKPKQQRRRTWCFWRQVSRIAKVEVFGHPKKSARCCQETWLGEHCFHLTLDPSRMAPIIRILKGNEFSPRFAKSSVSRHISALILLLSQN